MKIEYIKDWTGHKKGHIIDTDFLTAKWMVENEICVYVDEKSAKKANVYTDSKGKTYTEEEFFKMDKRTNIYKEIQANLK